MKKYTIKVVRNNKVFRFKTKNDIKLLKKVLKSTWGRRKFKAMCEFYDSISNESNALDEALEKSFPLK